MIKGKKILLLCVQTFGYEIAICAELERQGALVKYYDERPSNSNFTKGVIRVSRSLYEDRIKKYYDKILLDCTNFKPDVLFVIRGEVVPNYFLEAFKQRYPDCELVFYTWDSFTNHAHAVSILSYFDIKSTFDRADAIEHGIRFRPLFFRSEYGDMGSADAGKETYDLMFAGTAHSDRFQVSNDVSDWCDRHSLNSFFFYYQHGALVDVYKRIFDTTYKGVPFKKLSFTSISAVKMLELVKQSTVILDIQHPNQTGLTMRIFEAMGAGRKIITTNTEVKKYCFYNEENIHVISRQRADIELHFVQNPFVEIAPDIRDAMSISGWVKEVFSKNDDRQWLLTDS